MNVLHIDYEELIKNIKTVHLHQDAAFFFDFIRETINGNTEQTLEVIKILSDLDNDIKEIIEDFTETKYAETMLNAIRKARLTVQKC